MRAFRRETFHLHWISLRESVASSDTLPIATTSKLADIPDHALKVATGMNIVELRFLADADGASCTAHIFGTRKNDDISKIMSLAVTAGKQVATNGKYYADTLVTTGHWFQNPGIKLADATGLDRMARVAFDLLGYDVIFVLFEISSGTWSVDITGL